MNVVTSRQDSEPPPADFPIPAWSLAALDRRIHAAQGRLTQGLSLEALALAFFDWGMHLANAPYRRVDLAHLALDQARDLFSAALGIRPAPCIEPQAVLRGGLPCLRL